MAKVHAWELPEEIEEIVEGMEFQDDDRNEPMEQGQDVPIADEAIESAGGRKRKLEDESGEMDGRDAKRLKVDTADQGASDNAPQESAQDLDDEAWQREMAEEMGLLGGSMNAECLGPGAFPGLEYGEKWLCPESIGGEVDNGAESSFLFPLIPRLVLTAPEPAGLLNPFPFTSQEVKYSLWCSGED
jgi:hypothetical protein